MASQPNNNFALLLNSEVSSVITAMRQNDRWSVVQGRYYEQDRLEPDDFLEEFRILRRRVFQWEDWSTVNPLEYLTPFLHVIRAPEVSGPITGVALTSIWNLLNHNIIGLHTVGAREAMKQVVVDTCQCKFHATSSASDEVVLISIMQVLLAVVKCDAAVFLSDALICRAYQAAYMLGDADGKECSELLVHYSRQIVGEMTTVIFTRLATTCIPPPPSQAGTPVATPPAPGAVACEHGEEAAVEVLMFLSGLVRDEEVELGVYDRAVFALQMVHKLLLAAGPALAAFPAVMDLVQKELFATMVDVVRDASLPIINGICQVILVMFQVLREATLLQLETVIKKVLLRLADGLFSEGSSRTASRAMTTEQQEAALEGLLDLTRQPGFIHTTFLNCDCRVDRSDLFVDICELLSKTAFPSANQGLASYNLVSLEALLAVLAALDRTSASSSSPLQLPPSLEIPHVLDLWTALVDGRSPDLTALYGAITGGPTDTPSSDPQRPAAAASPTDRAAKPASASTTNLAALTPNGAPAAAGSPPPQGVAALLKAAAAERMLKTKVLLAADHFNRDFKKGFQFLQENKLLPVLHQDVAGPKALLKDPKLGVGEDALARAIGCFLRTCPGLNKTTIGELLGEPDTFYLKVLDAFSSTFHFRGMQFDAALRMFLESFKLPGEAQKIDRIVSSFGKYYHQATAGLFKHEDGPYILAYSVIILNTDRHNNQVKKKMSFEDFKRNLRGQNGGEDFREDFLLDIFNSIVRFAIRLNDTFSPFVSHSTWLNLASISATPRGTVLLPSTCGSHFDAYMFQLIAGPSIHALTEALDRSDPDTYASVAPMEAALEGLACAARVAARCNLTTVVDVIVSSLSKYNSALSPSSQRPMGTWGPDTRACLATQYLFKIVTKHPDSVRTSWVAVVDLVVRLHKLRLLPAPVLRLLEDLQADAPEGAPSRPAMRPSASASRLQPFSASSLIKSSISQLSSLLPLGADTAQADIDSQEEGFRVQIEKVLDSCHMEEVFEDSKFLRQDALQHLIAAIIRSGQQALQAQDGAAAAVSLELLMVVLIRNRDRLAALWPLVTEYLQLIISGGSVDIGVVETAVVGVLRLCRRLLPYKVELSEPLLKGVQLCTKLAPNPAWELAERISCELLAMLKAAAHHIQHGWAWQPVCNLLQMTSVRAEAFPNSLEAVQWCCEKGCLAPINFVPLLGAAVSMVEQAAKVHRDHLGQALLLVDGLGLWVEGWGSQDLDGAAAAPGEAPVESWAQQAKQTFWLALVDKLCKLATLPVTEARSRAVAALQRAVVTAERIHVSAPAWERALGEKVLPLLADLTEAVPKRRMPEVHETVQELVRVVSKVVLLHLPLLQQMPTFGALWQKVLQLLIHATSTHNEALVEAVPEALKNMLLVMHAKGVLVEGWKDHDGQDLWLLTWTSSAIISANLTPAILSA